MKLLELTLPTPEENLACDEALLEACESGVTGEILRFWTPSSWFVVLGYANRVAAEVDVAACAARGIPVFRRCSGGGTVLQGPGCLNYSLILKVDSAGPLRTITSANRFIMERHRAAIETLVPSAPGTDSKLRVEGHTDLALGGKKFSGNAQRRKKNCLLFHGAFLLQMNLELIEKVLPMPSKEPGYRRGRSHAQFLLNLALPAEAVKQALAGVWAARQPLKEIPLESIGALARDKYAARDWNFKF